MNYLRQGVPFHRSSQQNAVHLSRLNSFAITRMTVDNGRLICLRSSLAGTHGIVHGGDVLIMI